MEDFIVKLNSIVWGPALIILILGVGIWLSIGLKLLQVTTLKQSFVDLWKSRKTDGTKNISPFSALMTSLSATVGTGNIVGVATAISLGGPGALFWMWVTAFVGMATKYAETFCAIKFREKDENGFYIGGPMYYIKNGLGKNFKFLAIIFAICGTLAGFGIGNGVQVNSVAEALNKVFYIPHYISGIVMTIFIGFVLIGGIKRIAKVADLLVPFMIIFYVLSCLLILFMNYEKIIPALVFIVEAAFSGSAAVGGFVGATIIMAIKYGVARGIFSNESGLGSAPIAHAATFAKDPFTQGRIAMLGTFIDTIVICSLTGLVLIVTEVWKTGESGAALTSSAFSASITYGGEYILAISLATFAFTTIIGWSYYSEKCCQFLFGIKSVKIFRWIWVLAIPFGAIIKLDLIWLIADTLNAFMAVPNLIALILLSPMIFKETKIYIENYKKN